jgi:alpha-glucosidase (family GH31 glycosyl hydrolase)
MHDRMQYLRLMYTCMFESSRDGGSCLEPIEFRYPVDSSMFTESIDDVSASFIFARAIKVSPTFSPGNETISSYFPQGNWVNLANWTDIV